MADIATLGIKIDSSDVTKTTSALSGLKAAAGQATAATNEHGKAHAGLSSQAQAAGHSIRSMVESLASGMPVSQTLTQQIGHLSYAASGSGGLSAAFKQAGGALVGLLSPAALVAGGFAAIGVGGALAVSAIAKTEMQFDDVSRSIGITIERLHALESAGAFKGIDTAEFLKGMEKFGASVYDAQHGMGGLAETFRANNTSAKSFDDYLSKAADLIKNATNDQQRLQLLQEMGLPSTMQWVRLLQSGSEGIKAATDEAKKFGETADNELVAKARAFDEAWNRSSKNLSTGLRNAVIESASWLDTLSAKGTAFLMSLPGVGKNVPTNILRNAMTDSAAGYSTGSKLTAASNVDDLYKGTGAGLGAAAAADAKVKTLAERQHEITVEQPCLGLLGQTPVAADAKSETSKPEKKDDRDHRRLAA